MSRNQKSPSRKDLTYMAIDFGLKNIGLALGKAGLAQPVDVIDGKNEQEAISQIVKRAIEFKIDRFVVGLPLNAENKETKMSLVVRQFAKRLKIRSKKPVDFVNEYLSSFEAIENAVEMGTTKKSRQIVDSISAGIIMKKYFDENSTQ